MKIVLRWTKKWTWEWVENGNFLKNGSCPTFCIFTFILPSFSCLISVVLLNSTPTSNPLQWVSDHHINDNAFLPHANTLDVRRRTNNKQKQNAKRGSSTPFDWAGWDSNVLAGRERKWVETERVVCTREVTWLLSERAGDARDYKKGIGRSKRARDDRDGWQR